MEQGLSLPVGWTETALVELGSWSGGGTPSKSNPAFWIKGTIPWVSPKDMKTSRIRAAEDSITEEAVTNSSTKLIPENSVLMVTRSGILAHSFPVAVNECVVAVNQDLKTLTPCEGIEANYVAWYLRGQARHVLDDCSKDGTTVASVDTERLKKFSVPLAPLNEQRRIVEKIETLFARLDKGEEAVREVQKLLVRYRQSILKAAVTGELIESNRSSWEAVKLGRLLKDIRYGTAKKCSYETASTPVLRIPNVVGGEISLNDLKYADLAEKDAKKLALENGDLLIVRSNGSANLVARGAVVSGEAVGMAFAGYLIRLRVDQDRILPEYLHLSLKTPQTRTVIEGQARSTSGVHNINSSEVKAIAVQLPPIGEQREIVAAVEEAFNKIVDLERWCETELKRSASLRQSILKEAFSGRLVPQDPNDEPASELLARIEQTHTKAPSAGRRRATA